MSNHLKQTSADNLFHLHTFIYPPPPPHTHHHQIQTFTITRSALGQIQNQSWVGNKIPHPGGDTLNGQPTVPVLRRTSHREGTAPRVHRRSALGPAVAGAQRGSRWLGWSPAPPQGRCAAAGKPSGAKSPFFLIPKRIVGQAPLYKKTNF